MLLVLPSRRHPRQRHVHYGIAVNPFLNCRDSLVGGRIPVSFGTCGVFCYNNNNNIAIGKKEYIDCICIFFLTI